MTTVIYDIARRPGGDKTVRPFKEKF